MEFLRGSSADEMVAVFLGAEVASERFGDGVRAELTALGASIELVTRPDLWNDADNRVRQAVLAATRGYGRDAEMFEWFPTDVVWAWQRLNRDELSRVRYVDYEYWNELAGGTRLPLDAARRIEAGVTVFSVPNERFLRAADAIREGKQFPPLILAGPTKSDLVCLEGHLRLTAYALAGMPDELDCLVAVDPRLDRWAQ